MDRMPSAKQPPRRSVLIAARLITAVVALAGAEGVLWFGGYPAWWAMDPNWGAAAPQYQQDSELGWTAREGTFDLVWPGLRDSPQRTTDWSHGRRATSPHEPQDTAGRNRVMFFGDSYVQGYGLADSETFPWIVQQRHPDLAVSNFGVGDYGTYQSYLAMKRNVRGPATVYYMLNAFQEGRNVGSREWLRIYKSAPQDWFYPYAVLRSGHIEDRRSRGNLVWQISRHVRVAALVEEWMEIIATYPRVRQERAVTETLLADMNDVVRTQNGTFAVILFDLDAKQHQTYQHFLASHGIKIVDCDTPRLEDRKLRLPDGHPNPKLDSLLAGCIESGPQISAAGH
jgi:hypothetical protein